MVYSRLFVILCCLCGLWKLSSPAYAQNETQDVGLSGELYFPSQHYSGRQFLFDEWTQADIYTLCSRVYSNQKIQFDLLSGKLYWRTSSLGMHVLLEQNLIVKFEVVDNEKSQRIFERIEIPDPLTGRKSFQFVEVLHQGNWSLYAQRSSRAGSRRDLVNINGHMHNLPVLSANHRFFIKQKDVVFEIRLRHRSAIRTLRNYYSGITSLVKEHKLRINKEQALLELVLLIDDDSFRDVE